MGFYMRPNELKNAEGQKESLKDIVEIKAKI